MNNRRLGFPGDHNAFAAIFFQICCDSPDPLGSSVGWSDSPPSMRAQAAKPAQILLLSIGSRCSAIVPVTLGVLSAM